MSSQHQALALLAVLAVGCEGDVSLVVDLRTDFVPGVEFVAARTAVDGRVDDRVAARGDDFLRGIRIAEPGRFGRGVRDVTVTLLDLDGRELVQRHTVLNHDSDFAMTMLITRDCRDVTCPGAGDAAELSTCIAGSCADPTCNERDRSGCPADECAVATDCPAAAACAEAICVEGTCLYAPAGGACGDALYCDPEQGCLPIPTPGDAGTPDAGTPDAGFDAGGLDAGFDAGGLDAGTPDAGPTAVLRASGVSAGGRHTCAIQPSGDVYCWGGNGSRQLGRSGVGPFLVPQLSALGSAADVTAGFNHTCVSTPGGGDARCVGRGDTFELGDDIDPNLFSETPVVAVGTTGLEELFDGWNTCGIGTGGAVLCWGYNATAALGRGFESARELPGLVDAPGVSFVRGAAGAGHTCGVDNAGILYCWGEGSSGQIGDGSTTRHSRPTRVTAVPVDPSATVAAGEVHTCATSGGQLFCWGDNTFGQLGRASSGADAVPAVTPGVIADEVCAGEGYTCVRSGGAVRCFGLNDRGQLGRGVISPMASSPEPVLGLRDASAISCGKHHACALRTTGGVACWGEGVDGQLGDGRGVTSAVPVAVVAP